jgi:hypothetical protein
MDVPIQFFQSIIAIELAITGALLFQVRYFDHDQPDWSVGSRIPDPWPRLVVAVLLGATIFGSLDAMVHGGGRTIATAVSVGVALSALPILIRVLPPLSGVSKTGDPRRYSTVTVVGLLLYVAAVGGLIFIVNR